MSIVPPYLFFHWILSDPKMFSFQNYFSRRKFLSTAELIFIVYRWMLRIEDTVNVHSRERSVSAFYHLMEHATCASILDTGKVQSRQDIQLLSCLLFKLTATRYIRWSCRLRELSRVKCWIADNDGRVLQKYKHAYVFNPRVLRIVSWIRQFVI